MNRVFKYKNGEMKVTWNEVPMEKNYEEEWTKKGIIKPTRKMCNSFLVGLELKVHKGGRMCYGMLMARVQPSDKEDYIKTSIAFTKKNTIKYSNSLLSNDEYVYKGLPKEYVQSVFSSICEMVDGRDIFPQCEICFEYAANCEVGSSPRFFSIIVKVLLELIYENALDEIFNMTIADFTEKYVKDIDLHY